MFSSSAHLDVPAVVDEIGDHPHHADHHRSEAVVHRALRLLRGGVVEDRVFRRGRLRDAAKLLLRGKAGWSSSSKNIL